MFQSNPAARTYVLDTSVLLADPSALGRFEEHDVVLPVVVITELEAKRHHPDLGYFARAALRHLDELRLSHGRLDHPVPIGEQDAGVEHVGADARSGRRRRAAAGLARGAGARRLGRRGRLGSL